MRPDPMRWPPHPPVDAGTARRRRRSVTFWVATALTVTAAVVIAGGVAVWVVGFWMYATHDRIDLIDRPEVADAADAACAEMSRAVIDLTPARDATPAEVTSAMREQDAAVLAMVDDVRDLGLDVLRDDHPTLEWLQDWEDLVDARRAYSTALDAGARPVLDVPEVDGIPITGRMDDVGLACRVPGGLVVLP